MPAQLAPSQRPLMSMCILPDPTRSISILATSVSDVLVSIAKREVEAWGGGQDRSSTILLDDFETTLVAQPDSSSSSSSLMMRFWSKSSFVIQDLVAWVPGLPERAGIDCSILARCSGGILASTSGGIIVPVDNPVLVISQAPGFALNDSAYASYIGQERNGLDRSPSASGNRKRPNVDVVLFIVRCPAVPEWRWSVRCRIIRSSKGEITRCMPASLALSGSRA